MGSKVLLFRQRLAFLRRRLLNFTNRELRRLEFFPFSLLYVLLGAAIKAIQLRLAHKLVCAREVATTVKALPCSVMIWLDRVATGFQEPRFDVCLKLPCETADANLHDVFSVLLTSQRLRSVGLYWDLSSLANDQPLWQGKRDHREPLIWPTNCEDVGSLSFKQLQEFFQANHMDIMLPVSATRDAQTLLKRQAGKASAVCLNVPEELRSLADALVAARPDVQFFDLTPVVPTRKAVNIQSLHDYGLNLHERMALVQAADVYVGSFDQLGCVALISKRPAVLFGGATGDEPYQVSRGDMAMWFPGSVEPTALARTVLQFLSLQVRPTEIC